MSRLYGFKLRVIFINIRYFEIATHSALASIVHRTHLIECFFITLIFIKFATCDVDAEPYTLYVVMYVCEHVWLLCSNIVTIV